MLNEGRGANPRDTRGTAGTVRGRSLAAFRYFGCVQWGKGAAKVPIRGRLVTSDGEIVHATRVKTCGFACSPCTPESIFAGCEQITFLQEAHAGLLAEYKSPATTKSSSSSQGE